MRVTVIDEDRNETVTVISPKEVRVISVVNHDGVIVGNVIPQDLDIDELLSVVKNEIIRSRRLVGGMTTVMFTINGQS